jgi:hypothetical protein
VNPIHDFSARQRQAPIVIAMHLSSRAEQKKPGQSPPDKITAIGGVIGTVKKTDGGMAARSSVYNMKPTSAQLW